MDLRTLVPVVGAAGPYVVLQALIESELAGGVTAVLIALAALIWEHTRRIRVQRLALEREQEASE